MGRIVSGENNSSGSDANHAIPASIVQSSATSFANAFTIEEVVFLSVSLFRFSLLANFDVVDEAEISIPGH